MYFQSIVFLRAFAALAVCFFHFTCGNPTFLPNESWLKAIGAFGRYGVDIFFVVSGFVIPYSLAKRAYSRQDFFVFIRLRFLRIEVPYLASLILAIVVGSLVTFLKKEPFVWSWWQLIAHVFYLNNFLEIKWLVPVYWTLAIEFQYYIGLSLIYL
jgi:peptidoglycan/LPS O-acetylase OafA/YrhL